LIYHTEADGERDHVDDDPHDAQVGERCLRQVLERHQTNIKTRCLLGFD